MAKILRIRFIPSETIDLSSDAILYRDDNYLITSWNPIRPRNDIISGISCVFLKEGWKISAMMGLDHHVKYWYCDILDIQYSQVDDTFYLYDLLADVRITDDKVEVLDLDELAEAFDQGLITTRQLSLSLRRCNSLLTFINEHDVPKHVVGIMNKHTDWKCQI